MPERIYVPELDVNITFPDNTPLELKQRYVARLMAERSRPSAQPPAAPPPSSTTEDILRNVGGFALGVPRGIIEGVAAVPEGIGGITGSEFLKATGEAIRDNPLANLFAGEASTGRMAGELVGNLATYLAPGSVAKLAGAPRLATTLAAIMGGASGAAEQVREAAANRQAGMAVSPEQEQLAAMMGGATGLADIIPAERFISRFSPLLRGANELAQKTVGQRLGMALGTGALEGGTELGQQIAQNVIEQQVYNPQQETFEGALPAAGTGLAVGTGLDFLLTTLGQRVARKMQPRIEQARQRQQGAGPAVPAGPEDAIGIRRTEAGEPEITVIPRAGARPAPTPPTVSPASPAVSPALPPEDLAFAQDLADLNRQQQPPATLFPSTPMSERALGEFLNLPEASPIANLPMEDLGGAGEFTPSGRSVPAVDPLAPGLFRDRPREMRGTGAPLSASQEIPQAPLASIADLMREPAAPEDIPRDSDVVLDLLRGRPSQPVPPMPYAETLELGPQQSYLQDALAQQRAESQRLAESQAMVDQLLAAQRAPVPEPAPAPSRIAEPLPPIRPAVPPPSRVPDLLAEEQAVVQPARARVAEQQAREQRAEADRVQAEADRITARTEAEATRAARRTQAPVVPETGVPNEIALDAQQRLAREEFNRNLTELNPDELAIVQAKQESGLGSAVRPQELADVREFADLPFTRDQYRQALEIGKPGGTATLPSGLTTPRRIAQTLDVPIDTAERMVETMIRRGDAAPNADRFSPQPAGPSAVRVREEATGPRYSVESQPDTGTKKPREEAYTVASLRSEVENNQQPQIALDIFRATKGLGIDDLVSTRLIDSFKETTKGTEVLGSYRDQIISLALAGRNADQLKSTLNHEAVHAMKKLGIFSDSEWALLESAFDPNTILSDDERKFYKKAYANNPDLLREESIAKGMQRHLEGSASLPPKVANLIDQKTEGLARMGDSLIAQGLTTPSKVVQAFSSGDLGRREIPGSMPRSVAAEVPVKKAAALEDLLMGTDEGGFVTGEQPPAALSVVQEPVEGGGQFAEPDLRGGLRRTLGNLFSEENKALRNRMQLLDARAPIEAVSLERGDTEADTSAIAAVRIADNAPDLAAASFKYGAVRYVGTPGNGYFIAGNSPAPLGKDGFLTKVYEAGKLDKFFHYLLGERSGDLIEVGKEKRLTPAQIRQYRSYGEDPVIKAAAAQWKQFNDTNVKMLVDSGRITAEDAARLTRGLYLPFYRVVDEATGDISFQPSGQTLGAPTKLKKLFGGESQIADPIENIVRNVNALTAMATKNEAMQRVMRDGIDLGYVEQASPKASGDQVVTVYVKGKPKKFFVKDKLLYDSVMFSRYQPGEMMQLLGLPAKWLRDFVTLAPTFPIRNLMRDSVQISLMGYTDMPVISALQGAKKAIQESDSYQTMEKMGIVSTGIRGEGGGEGTAREIRRLIEPDMLGALDKYIQAWERFNQKGESANRLIVFEKAIADGKTPAQAASEAREIIDFNRRGAGAFIQAYSALVPFQNARLQGLDVAYRALRPGQSLNPQMRKQLASRMAAMTAATVLYSFLIQDSPAYKQASEEERDNYWFLPLPNGEAFRVPIPFEMGFVAKVVPERMANWMAGTEDGKIFMRSMVRFILGTMKMEAPQFAKPAFEVYTNFDNFRQKPIETEWMKRLEKADRTDDRTTETAKILSEISGNQLSPVQADHLLRGYTGTIGQYVASFVDFATNPSASKSPANRDLSETPVFGALFQRRDGGRKLAEAYEIRSVAEQAAASLRARMRDQVQMSEPERQRLIKQSGLATAINPLEQAQDELNRAERRIRAEIKAGRMTADQADQQLEGIRSRKLEIADRIIEISKTMR
jgi:hypothetical protein